MDRWAQPFPRTRMRPERPGKGPKPAEAVKLRADFKRRFACAASGSLAGLPAVRVGYTRPLLPKSPCCGKSHLRPTVRAGHQFAQVFAFGSRRHALGAPVTDPARCSDFVSRRVGNRRSDHYDALSIRALATYRKAKVTAW
jgi:hypothetical protein